LHGRPEANRFHARGFIEEGTTTTPFDMVVLNKMSRVHLSMDAVRCAPNIGNAAELIARGEEVLARHRQYVQEYFEDLPEIRNWVWSGAGIGPLQTAAFQRNEDWKQEDDERFDVLVEKEARGQLNEKEANELERLSQKRDRTVVNISEEDLRQERMRSAALAEIQSLLQKYAHLFSTKR
jgi:hypothetical protein